MRKAIYVDNPSQASRALAIQEVSHMQIKQIISEK